MLLKAMADHSQRLESVDIERLFSSFSDFNSLTLGVSGGADSVALLVLMSEWKAGSNWPGQLDVVTVDHALRSESEEEALFVASVCEAYQVSHHTLRWIAPKSSSNLQAEARNARYELISAYMRTRGSQALVLAHHLDDQIETFLDRLTRGSGVYGLSAMAADEANGPFGLRILRPFLSVRKEQLIRILETRKLSWREDPSNQNEKYKRVRLRRLAAQLENEGLDLFGISQTAARLRRSRDAIEQWVATFWQEKAALHPAGPVRFCRSSWEQLPLEVRLRVLSHAILIVSGASYTPRLGRLESLETALRTPAAGKYTLGGTVISSGVEDIRIWKELGREQSAPQRLVEFLSADTVPAWAEHFEATAPLREMAAVFGQAMIGPLKSAPKTPEIWSSKGVWPREAFSACPAIWQDEVVLHAPGLYSNRAWDTECVELRKKCDIE